MKVGELHTQQHSATHYRFNSIKLSITWVLLEIHTWRSVAVRWARDNWPVPSSNELIQSLRTGRIPGLAIRCYSNSDSRHEMCHLALSSKSHHGELGLVAEHMVLPSDWCLGGQPEYSRLIKAPLIVMGLSWTEISSNLLSQHFSYQHQLHTSLGRLSQLK